MNKRILAFNMLAVVLSGMAIAPAGAETPSAVKLEPDTVLVRRGEAEITLREFEAALSHVPESHRSGVAGDPQRLAKFLEQLLQRELLSLEAQNADLDGRESVQLRIRLAEQQVLAQAMLKHVRDGARPADYEQQAREHYLTHKEEFRVPERVTVSHVLIGTRQRNEAEARELAEEVAAKAKSGEVSFEALVQEYSDDPSAARNQGRFNDIRRGQMVKPFEEAAFSLQEPGAIAGPVKTEYGYHVIKLHERKPAQTRPFEAVKDSLVEKMKQQHLQRAEQEYVNGLLEKNPLQAEEAVIRALRNRYSSDSDSGDAKSR